MPRVNAEDLDPIGEDDIEVREGHPVDVVISVRLTADESRALSELAQRDGTDAVETIRAAVREYAASRSARATD